MRWREHWGTQAKALAFYRRIWQEELAAGRQPGDPIRSPSAHRALFWLVKAHPQYATMVAHAPLAYFTFERDGRGNCRFVLVNSKGDQHPFSTLVALTGRETPLANHRFVLKTGVTSDPT